MMNQERRKAVEFALSGVGFVRQKPIPLFYNFATAPLTIKRFCRERSVAQTTNLPS